MREYIRLEFRRSVGESVVYVKDQKSKARENLIDPVVLNIHY